MAVHGQNDEPNLRFEPELKLVTSLFVDLVGSLEAISEIGPQRAGMLFEACRAQLTHIAHRHFGTVGTIAGDGILFLFGAPIANSRHASNACLAALSMIAATRHKNWPLQSLDVRVGLCAGETLVRPIETDIGWHYDATGVCVHVASRLQAMAEPGQCICDQLTHDLAGEGFVFEDFGQSDVRGFPQPLRIFHLAGVKTNPLTPAAATELTFRGREAEIAQLKEICLSPPITAPQVVLIVGDAGIGKSKLIAEANAALEDHDGPPALFCRGFYGLVEPFSAIRECVKQLLPQADLLSADDFATRVQDSQNAGQKDAHAMSALRNLHKELFDSVRPQDGTAQKGLELSVGKKLNTIRRGFENLIHARRHQGTVALLIDEFLELDSESREIFLRMMSPETPFPATFVLTCRTERVAELLANDVANIEIIKLGGLTDEAAIALADEIAAGSPSAPQTEAVKPDVHDVVRRSGGNPLFLREMLSASHGAQFAISGRSGIVGGVSGVRTPVLQSVIAERIDHLSNDQKRALKITSILGEVVPEQVLSIVFKKLGHDWASVEEVIAGRMLSMVDTADGAELRFTHPLFREISEASIVERDQIAFHAAAYEVIRQSAKGGGKAAALSMARHARSAHLWADACESSLRAAVVANEQAMNSQALELLTDALGLSDRLHDPAQRAQMRVNLLLEMRNPLYQIGDLGGVENSLNAAKTALKGRHDPIEHGKILSFESHVHWLKGKPTMALECARQISQIAAAENNEALNIRSYFHFGLASLGAEKHDEAIAHMERVTAAISKGVENDRLGINQSLLVLAKSYMARSLMSLGRVQDSVRMAQEAVASAARTDDILAHIIARMSAGMVLLSAAEIEASETAFDSAQRLLDSVEARLMQPIFDANFGLMLLCTGEAEQALGRIETAIEQSAKIGLRFELGKKYINLALCHYTLGHSNLALSALETSAQVSMQSEEFHTASVAADLSRVMRSEDAVAGVFPEGILPADPSIRAFIQAQKKRSFADAEPVVGHDTNL